MMYLQQKTKQSTQKKAGLSVSPYITEPSHWLVVEWLLSPQRDA